MPGWTKRFLLAAMVGAIPCVLHGQAPEPRADALRAGFQQPPAAAKLRCYWWWLNGNTTNEAITRDLEQMKSHGIGGAILVDADGSGQDGNAEVPMGPPIGSPRWIALFVHALSEAKRLGLEISLSVTSRWDVGIIGGPTVKPEDAIKMMTWSRIIVDGGGRKKIQMPMPPAENGFYQPIAVLAYPLHHGAPLPGSAESDRRRVQNLEFKSASRETGFSMPRSDEIMRDGLQSPARRMPRSARLSISVRAPTRMAILNGISARDMGSAAHRLYRYGKAFD